MPQPPRAAAPALVDAVLIGRNEGERLRACLASLSGRVRHIIYVDSGSTDGSAQLARAAGAEVVDLEMTRPFTAARARNAGLAWIWALPAAQQPRYVQLLDGDCALDPDWLPKAIAKLEAEPDTAVVCGRRRERHPEASVYNRLADAEWDTPIGEAKACGGDALMRLSALHEVGGYREDLIAGEEPEMCLRLRAKGWKIWRIDAEMTLHDAAMHRFSQWWRRTKRAGHAFAEGAALHGAPPERHWVAETRRALIWGAGLPCAIALAALLWHPLAIGGLLAYPAQILRLAPRMGIEGASFLTLGKFAEAQGVIGYWVNRLRGQRTGLIEYK